MATKTFALIAVTAILQACSQVPVADTSSITRNSASQPAASYQPENHEQFVLAEKPDQLQQYGFDGFCTTTESFACGNRLHYDRYVGMKGYFKTDEPAHTDFSGYQFWPVVLENGREFFYVSNPEYGGKYGSSANIVPLEQYEQASNYTAEPLVQGSSIQVASVEISFGKDVYTLSNGTKIGNAKLIHIRNIASQFPASTAKVAEALLEFKISHDEVEQQYFIQPKGSILKNEAKLYVGVKPNETWLRMKIKYYGDDWLFVRAYKIAADALRWESPVMQFERDHSGGNVWEWIDKAPSAENLRNMRALATAESPVIRFQGRQYYSDFKLTSEQQVAISSVLELYELIER